MPSLRAKIVIVVTAISMTSAGLSLGLIGAKRVRDHLMERSAAALREEARLVLWRVQDSFGVPLNDALMLAETPPISGMIRAEAFGGFDPQENSTDGQWRNRLSEIFTAMMRTRPEYFQIRFITFADDGRERVRIEREEGEIVRIPEEQLQRKGHESYFAEAGRTGPGRAALTEVTFNRENGRRDPRDIRTLRALAPVHRDDGSPFGFIIINVDLQVLIGNALQRISPSSDMLLFSALGDFALSRHVDGVREDSFGNTETAPEAPPELALAVARAADASYIDHGRIYGTAIAQNGRFGLTPLRAVAWRSTDSFTDALEAALIEGLLIEIALCTGAALLAAVAASRLTRHLRVMNADLAAYDGGDPAALRLPVESPDEIGALARTFRDLLQRLRETETKAQSVIDDLLEAVVVIDERGRIEEFSRAAERLFGVPAQQALGRDVGMLMPEAEREGHGAAVRRYGAGGPRWMVGRRREVMARRRDGSPFPAEVSVSELRIGGRRLFSAVIRDTSDQNMRKRATEFISTVSHELRTPLTSIMASLSMLERLSGPQMDERSARLLTLARNGGDRLARIVDDILDLEKIEQGKVEFRIQSCDLRELTGAAVERVRARAEEKSLRLKLEVSAQPCRARLDPHRYEQALGNLLSNALRHSPEGGVVEVRVRRLDDNRARVTVRDHGPGVPEPFRDRIFERFAQAEPGGGGSGLGLNIGRGLVRAFGGELLYETPAGGGASFHIELPLQGGKEGEARANAVEA